MSSDRAFLRERLAWIEGWLANPVCDLEPAEKRRVRRLVQPGDGNKTAYRREARLLRKLLRQTGEGQVLKTLEAWRRQLGGFLTQHRRRTKAQQNAYNAWLELPRYKRQYVPKPPRPPSARYLDRHGAEWVIDDQFLALLDDLIERLQKWNQTE